MYYIHLTVGEDKNSFKTISTPCRYQLRCYVLYVLDDMIFSM